MPPIGYFAVSIRFRRILMAVFYKKMSNDVFHIHCESPKFFEVVGSADTMLKVNGNLNLQEDDTIPDREQILALINVAISTKEKELSDIG